MKKQIRVAAIVLLVILAAGFAWWQFNKKRIIRHTIENAVSKGTDSVYIIHYDSSRIDELAGNATFYNLTLQSDSLQELLYTNDTASLAPAIFNVHIKQLTIRGVNIPGLLQKTQVHARSIEITEPVIRIINTGKKSALTQADSLALYERLTGKFNSIDAGSISIINGTVLFSQGKAAPNMALQGVNIDLNNLKIDSTHNYDNIISYFIKDVVAKVKTVTLKKPETNRTLSFTNIEYNAPGRFLQVDQMLDKNEKTGQVLLELNNNRVTNLSTNAFILNRQVKADSLRTKGGELVIYRTKKAKNNAEGMEFDNDYFDEAFVKNISLGKTTIRIYDRSRPQDEPVVVKDVEFSANGLSEVYSGSNISRIVSNSNWMLASAGVELFTADRLYKTNIGAFKVDNAAATANITEVSVTPVMSEDAFMRSRKVQTDQYTLRFKNLSFKGLEAGKLLNEQILIAQQLDLQPFLHVYNDRTLPPDESSKIGKYPHQMLMNLKFPLYIKSMVIHNGDVVYKERGAISKKAGDVSFRNVNGTVSNVTNIPAYIKQNNMLVLNATAKFLGLSALKTEWRLPLDTKNGEFAIKGTAGAFDATKLTPVIQPLGMAAIKKGTIKSLVFDMTGNDLESKGVSTLMYNNLKVTFLKNDDNGVKSKAALSLVANIFLKDNNPSNGVTRSSLVDLKRDTTRSFFNLVWKSLFNAAKKTAQGGTINK